MAMFSRMKQTMKEATGTGAKTEYGIEFTTKNTYADATNQQVDKFVDKTKTHISSYGEGTLNKVEAVGEPAQALAQKLNTDNPYIRILTQVYEAEKQIGTLQRQYQKQIEERVLNELKNWMRTDYDQLKKERSKLEDRRKEMDAALNKAKKVNTQEVKDRVDTTTTAHNNQLKTVEKLQDRLPDVHKTHARIMKTFLQIQREHHQKVAAALSACLEKC